MLIFAVTLEYAPCELHTYKGYTLWSAAEPKSRYLHSLLGSTLTSTSLAFLPLLLQTAQLLGVVVGISVDVPWHGRIH